MWSRTRKARRIQRTPHRLNPEYLLPHHHALGVSRVLRLLEHLPPSSEAAFESMATWMPRPTSSRPTPERWSAVTGRPPVVWIGSVGVGSFLWWCVPRYGQPVSLMSTEWHPFWTSYEWWRDIGTGLLGVVAATIVGGVSVWLALRSNRVARETVEYTKRVRAEDEKREERDRLRQAQLERIAFASQVRLWIRGVEDLERQGLDEDDGVSEARTQLDDQMYDFDHSGRQELLSKIDEILATEPDPVDGIDREARRRRWIAREIRKQQIPLLIQGYVRGDHLPNHGLPVDK